MIFGFNTDVKIADLIYHVQSEARHSDLQLQTMIFVRGQCIGKYASSYAEQSSQSGFSEDHIHELLKAQHRMALEMVRDGKVGELLRFAEDIQDAEGDGLVLKWLNEDSADGRERFVMQLMVSDLGIAAEGALVTCRLAHSPETPIHSQSVTESDGNVELEIDLRGLIPRDSDPVLLVRAKHGEKSATRQFRLKRS
jgi:hypothetical protein